MAAQKGYFDTLQSVAGKVFSYLASITLTGTDGKTITCTQDTSLDEAVAMSSKAPKGSPSFTGIITKSSVVREFIVSTSGLDTTVAIVLTYPSYGQYEGHVLEIFVSQADSVGASNYSSIVRYAVCAANANAYVLDLTHDLGTSVTEAVSITGLVVTVTLTMPTAADVVTVYVKDVAGSAQTALTSVTVS